MEEKPKVYFRSARASSVQSGLVPSMLTVFEAAGLDKLIKPKDVVAIKIHCGEWNNTAYLRPVYARTLADRIKELGGRPFVCDTTTLPYNAFGGRASAMDILYTAERNGFNATTLGCPFVVADGSSGRDDVRVDLPEGFILREAFVAHAIANADVMIALTHFKGHSQGMIGGSIKNLGIGCQSQRGKHNVHMGGHPRYGLGAATDFHPELCMGRKECPTWELCQNCCPWGLFEVTADSIKWGRERCTNCNNHLGVNTWCGVFNFPSSTYEATNTAIADACLGAVKAVGRDKVGFINMALDVSPVCDCAGFADIPVVPNIGVFASKDPVAIDAASKDKVTASVGMPGSLAEELGVAGAGMTKLEVVAGRACRVSEEIQINTGVLNGLGRRDYELIELPAPEDRIPFVFAPDKRPSGIRHGHRPHGVIASFPYDRMDGRGFDRKDEVDFALVRDKPATLARQP